MENNDDLRDTANPKLRLFDGTVWGIHSVDKDVITAEILLKGAHPVIF